MKMKRAMFFPAAAALLAGSMTTAEAEASAPTSSVMPIYAEIWNGFYGPDNFSAMLKADCIAIDDGESYRMSSSNEVAAVPAATIRLTIDDERYAEWKAHSLAALEDGGFGDTAVDIEDPTATLVAGRAYAFGESDMREIAALLEKASTRLDEMSVEVSAFDTTGGVAKTWSIPLPAFRRAGNDTFRLPFRGLNRLQDIPVVVWDWRIRGVGASGSREYATAEVRLSGCPAFCDGAPELRCAVKDAARAVLDGESRSPIDKLFDDMAEVSGSDVHLSRHETTQELWEAIMGENPSYRKNPAHPVEMVSIADIAAFVEKLNEAQEVAARGVKFRLPTEQEWEMACRAGGTNEFGLVAEELPGDPDALGWHKGNSGGVSHAVGRKEPNRWGFFDMHGNVREWTSSRKGFFHSVKGGGWADNPDACSASRRLRFIPEIKNYDLGFRLAY